MRTSRIYLLAIAALALAAVALSGALAQPAATAPALRAAACDIVLVFNSYQRAKDLSAQLQDRRKAIQAENAKRVEAIKALRLEMEGLKKGSPEYQKRGNEMRWQDIQREAYLQYQDALAVREHYELTVEMYEEMTRAVAQIAQERGFGLVLQREGELQEVASTAELVRQIHDRKVLYAADSIDLTTVVLDRLNKAYEARKPAAPATSQP